MKPRILVVEDETIVALEIRERLLDLGFDVPKPLASGEEVLAEVARCCPDLVLMDIRIRGELDGIEVARRLRRSHDLQVVFLTAYADRETLDRAKAAAPSGYLLKPFDNRLLEITVETALLRQRMSRQKARWEAQRSQFIRRILSAQEDERRRVARDLHDVLGQELTSALVRLGSLEALVDDETGARSLVGEIRRNVSGAMEAGRRLVRGLRPVGLESLGLKVALERLVEDFSCAHDIPVDLHLRGFYPEHPRLPADLEVSLYRISQEALTNVARHAGARSASLVAERRDRSLRLVVEDDGRGFAAVPEAESDGIGLHGIRERVDLVGGTLTIESSPGQTALFVRVPVPEAGDETSDPGDGEAS